MLPVIVTVWPAPAKVNVTSSSKVWIESNVKSPAPLVTLLLTTFGSAKLAFIPKPLTVVTPSTTPLTEATGTTKLSLIADVVVVVIVTGAIARLVN